MSNNPKIILASSSVYRQALLRRLQLEFDCISPNIDETPHPGELPEQLVTRLATSKALQIAKTQPDSLIIGSDQVASLGSRLLGKPGNRENAVKQLQLMRGKTVLFITGLCVVNAQSGQSLTDIVIFPVLFRAYTDAEIERYLDKEAPFDCAGSFKSEQLGITLIQNMQGDDPTALIGLPLIRLSEMLRQMHLQLP